MSVCANECLPIREMARSWEVERKTFGKMDGICLLRNEELYQKNKWLVEWMRKWRLKYYWHLFMMDDKRLTKQISKIFNNRVRISDEWFKEVRKDLKRIRLTRKAITNRPKGNFKQIDNFRGFYEEQNQNSGWTQERRLTTRERML